MKAMEQSQQLFVYHQLRLLQSKGHLLQSVTKRRLLQSSVIQKCAVLHSLRVHRSFPKPRAVLSSLLVPASSSVAPPAEQAA